jgi:hypothetical protein
MPDYASSLNALVDERIDAAMGTATHMGTVAVRATTGNYAEVIFDGTSGVAMPVKCFEPVIVQPGDRVGLAKFGSDWIIVGNYTLRTLADVSMLFGFTGTGTTSVGTYADMQGSPTLTYTKVRDLTFMRYEISVTGYCTTPPNGWQQGCRITSADGVTVAYDQGVRVFTMNAAVTHTTIHGFVIASTAHPAGVYTMVARWARVSGAGVLDVDTADMIQMTAREVVV